MKKIILDTNFLTIPYQFNVNIIEEIECLIDEKYEILTTDGVVKELENLSKKSGKDGIAAKIGLEIIKKEYIKIIKTKGNTDDVLVEISDENTIIATNDKILRQRLKSKRIKTIYLRSKKQLELG